ASGIASCIEPVQSLQSLRWPYRCGQLGLIALAVSYSSIASLYRPCAANTWPFAKYEYAVRGDAVRACSASPSARAMSTAAESAISSRRRLARRGLRRGKLRIERQCLLEQAICLCVILTFLRFHCGSSSANHILEGTGILGPPRRLGIYQCLIGRDCSPFR